MTRIDREAAPATAIAALPSVVALLAGRRGLAAGLAVLPAAIAAFFRDPDRTPDHRPAPIDDVLSPADGKVMYVGPGQDLVAPEGEWQQISIFLSAFDVHVNRLPIDGTIGAIRYHPGKFLNAALDKASEDNERNAVRIDTAEGSSVVVVQIAGLIARRIKCWIGEGQTMRAGARFGLIRFGSRVDVYLPEGTEPLVVLGQKVIAGETVLARIGEARLIEGVVQ